MKIYITIILVAFTIAFTRGDELPKASSTESDAIVAKSSVAKKPAKDDEKKIDLETKEQLQESANDDKELEKQEDAKANAQSTSAAEEEDDQDSDDGSAEEPTDDNEAENDDAPDEDQSTIKRAEGAKGEKDKKKNKKFLAYPLFYPGDYFGAHGHNVGGPLGFHPGSVWEYPYPYVHPMYPSPFYPCQCNCKDDKEKEKDKKEKDKKTRRKQLVPSHYYGPPSAGWGAYQPGHTGAGWGAPYWYKSYIPVGQQQTPEGARTEGAQARHIIQDGLDFGLADSHDSARISYGQSEDGLDLGDFGDGWHDGYTEHPVYGSYNAPAGHTAYVDPVYGDLESNGLTGWGHGVGRPYLAHGEEGYGAGHGYAESIGHPYLPSHEGMNHGPVHHGETFFGPHTAMLPTAQGHIQVASAGHAVGMGGHNLGGFADKINPSHGTQGDFVGGIHTDLGSHDITGHHHDHAAAGHTNAPLLHTGHVGQLHGSIGDHFGPLSEHHQPRVDLGMPDHFGPVMEHTGGHEGFAAGHGEGGHDVLHGHHGGHHAMSHRVSHGAGVHGGHVGALDGQIGDTLSAGHLFGVHKSGVPAKGKGLKKLKPKAKQNKKMGKSR